MHSGEEVWTYTNVQIWLTILKYNTKTRYDIVINQYNATCGSSSGRSHGRGPEFALHGFVDENCAVSWRAVSFCTRRVWCRQFPSPGEGYIEIDCVRFIEKRIKGEGKTLFWVWPGLACHACARIQSLLETHAPTTTGVRVCRFHGDLTRRRNSGWPGGKCQGWTLTRPRWPCYGHRASSQESRTQCLDSPYCRVASQLKQMRALLLVF
jgi:hypothetical protein